MVDRRIFVVGFGLYGSSSGAADYNVRIELKKYGEVSTGVERTIICEHFLRFGCQMAPLFVTRLETDCYDSF